MLKTLKSLLLWNQKADDLESSYAASGTRVLPNLFYEKVKFGAPLLLYGKKLKHCFFFSETIVVFDIKVGGCSQLMST